MHFGGHEYNALERRGGGGSSAKENTAASGVGANPRAAAVSAAPAKATRSTPVRAPARDVSNVAGSAPPSRPGSSMGKRPGDDKYICAKHSRVL